MITDLSLLQAARIGYQRSIEEVDARIAQLTSKPQPRWDAKLAEVDAVTRPPKKRKMSAAGRKRISDATKKRWADLRALKAKTAKASAA